MPEFKINAIKAKVDSGAKTSALHAENIQYYKRGARTFVKFKVYPIQRTTQYAKIVTAELYDERWVTSSVGHRTLRPVVKTVFRLGEVESEMELTLVNRDVMGFRMLLGREAFRKIFLIDANRSYVIGKNKKKLKKSSTSQRG